MCAIQALECREVSALRLPDVAGDGIRIAGWRRLSVGGRGWWHVMVVRRYDAAAAPDV
jgi:hypothetical protein